MWLATVTFDALDPLALARFWGALLDGDVGDGLDDGEVLVRLPGSTTNLLFMPVGDPTPGKNRVHLDVHTTDLDAAVARAEGLGGTALAHHQETSRWAILTDPEGNELCLVERTHGAPPTPYAGVR